MSKTTQAEGPVVEFDVEVLVVGAAKEELKRDKTRVDKMLQYIVYKLCDN